MTSQSLGRATVYNAGGVLSAWGFCSAEFSASRVHEVRVLVNQVGSRTVTLNDGDITITPLIR